MFKSNNGARSHGVESGRRKRSLIFLRQFHKREKIIKSSFYGGNLDKARKNLSDITGKIGDCREVHGKLSNGEVSDKYLIDEPGIDTDGLNCTCNGGKLSLIHI